MSGRWQELDIRAREGLLWCFPGAGDYVQGETRLNACRPHADHVGVGCHLLCVLCYKCLYCAMIDKWHRSRIASSKSLGCQVGQKEYGCPFARYWWWSQRCQHDSGGPCRCWYIWCGGMWFDMTILLVKLNISPGLASSAICGCCHLSIQIPAEIAIGTWLMELSEADQIDPLWANRQSTWYV